MKSNTSSSPPDSKPSAVLYSVMADYNKDNYTTKTHKIIVSFINGKCLGNNYLINNSCNKSFNL